MSPEIRLMIDPRGVYRALLRDADTVTPLTALRRPLLAALALGVAVSVAGTGRVTPALVASTTIMWSYVIVVQVLIALLVIATAPARTIGVPRALDLFFAGHAPWSLTALLAAAWAPAPLSHPLWVLEVIVVAPLLLMPRIVAAFCREVLGLEAAAARRRTLIHQAITWSFALGLLDVQSALAPRVLEWMGRS
jgi:hypothetical protein